MSCIVDSSHFPRRARELQALNGIDLYILFLVRDPHSVVASWGREDVIEPQFGEYVRKSFTEDGGGKLVVDRFSYGSDNNTEWLDAPELIEILDKHAS